MGKLVRCSQGAIFDVAVDLRAGSPTFGRWFGVELTDQNMKQLWVPVGFGHGFATLSEVADVQYKCSGFYAPAAEGTLAWNDPDVGVEWPVRDPILSRRDQNGLSLRQYLENPAFHYRRQAG
jgi:dTDP-4-dehydrorhamnose 3,5-epimerase